MDSQNTPFTVQLGQGASIRLGEACISTGAEGATIRFGNFETPIVVPARSTSIRDRLGGRSRPTEVTAVEIPRKKVSVFERLGLPETQVIKRTVMKGKISLTHMDVAHLSAEPFVAGRNDTEASSSGGKLSKTQRRKLNARLRAQNLLSESPTMQRHVEPVAMVPTYNKFQT